MYTFSTLIPTSVVLNWEMCVAIINVSLFKELLSHTPSLIALWLSWSLKFRNNVVVVKACIRLILSSHKSERSENLETSNHYHGYFMQLFQSRTPKEMQKVSALEESKEKKYISVSEVLTYCCSHSVCSSLSLVSCSWCEEKEVCHVYTVLRCER